MKLIWYTGPYCNSYVFFYHYHRIEFEFEILEIFDSHVCQATKKIVSQSNDDTVVDQCSFIFIYCLTPRMDHRE